MKIIKTMKKKVACSVCGTNEYYVSSRQRVKCKRGQDPSIGAIGKESRKALDAGKTTFICSVKCKVCKTNVRYAKRGICVNCNTLVRTRKETDFLPGSIDWISSRYLRMQLA